VRFNMVWTSASPPALPIESKYGRHSRGAKYLKTPPLCQTMHTMPLKPASVAKNCRESQIAASSMSFRESRDSSGKMMMSCPSLWMCAIWYVLVIICGGAKWPNDPKLSHGAKNCKREFAANLQMKGQPPLAPARC
jgi:hypothetical protein